MENFHEKVKNIPTGLHGIFIEHFVEYFHYYLFIILASILTYNGILEKLKNFEGNKNFQTFEFPYA